MPAPPRPCPSPTRRRTPSSPRPCSSILGRRRWMPCWPRPGRVLKPGGRLVSVDQDAGTRVIDHPDRQTTRAIINYACGHLSADGWLGRLLRSAGFSVESVEIHPHLATSPRGYMFDGAIRFAQAAMDGGAITPEAGRRWIGQLHELAQAGSFLASVNCYVTAAELSRSGSRSAVI